MTATEIKAEAERLHELREKWYLGEQMRQFQSACLETTLFADVAALAERCEALEKLLRRIHGWDHMDTAADGSYWRREITEALNNN